ncbi:MAG: DUF951 domain-containing protein [Armatimonadetes bacterium]|nr:DUF951 domain-containing protein [Armatimonadota bacterium]
MPVPQPPSQPAAPSRPLQRVEPSDRVLMRKKHPCGSFEWTVTRVGADIGLRCDGCYRRMMLPRDAFNRAARRILTPLSTEEAELWNPDAASEGGA